MADALLSKKPTHLTRSQVARNLKLKHYYLLAPILRIAEERGVLHTIDHLGVKMIPTSDIPALVRIRKELDDARSARQ